MSRRKLIALISLGCFFKLMQWIFIGIVLGTALWHFGNIPPDNAEWRANRFRYDDDGQDGQNGQWWHGEYLLWHDEQSFDLMYRSSEIYDWVAATERIGWVTNLPAINLGRSDRNYLGSAHVHHIEGFSPEEWIYVIYEEIHNMSILSRHHRIYRATNIDGTLEKFGGRE